MYVDALGHQREGAIGAELLDVAPTQSEVDGLGHLLLDLGDDADARCIEVVGDVAAEIVLIDEVDEQRTSSIDREAHRGQDPEVATTRQPVGVEQRVEARLLDVHHGAEVVSRPEAGERRGDVHERREVGVDRADDALQVSTHGECAERHRQTVGLEEGAARSAHDIPVGRVRVDPLDVLVEQALARWRGRYVVDVETVAEPGAQAQGVAELTSIGGQGAIGRGIVIGQLEP